MIIPLDSRRIVFFIAFWLIPFCVHAQNPIFGDPIYLPTGNSPSYLAVADINNDLKPDIIVSHAGESSLKIYLNDVIS